MSLVVRVSFLLSGLAACSVGSFEVVPHLAIETRADAAGVAVRSARAGSRAATAEGQDPESLAVWRSEQFKRQFVASYAAETDIEPRLTSTERDLMQKVYELMAADQALAAQELLEREQGEAVTAVFDFTLGNLHFGDERLEPAAQAYQKAVAKFPKFRRAWRNLALVHVRQGEYVPAITALTRVLELGGTDSTSYGLLGFCYGNTASHLAAESAYRMAVLMDPALRDWQLGLARSLFEQERFAEAAALCGPLLRQDPDRGEYWLLQANAYLGMGNANQAAENLEMADRLGQATAESLNTLGDIYVNEELFELAVGAYLRAIDAGQPSPSRPLRAARVLTARGAHAEVRQLLLAIDQSYGPKLGPAEKKDLLHLRSRLAMAEGAGDEEARVLEEIVALDPLDGEALILLGQHSQRTGKLEQAAFYYERAANIADFEADAKVRHAQLLITQARYREALPLLQQAQARSPRANVAQYLEQVERLAGGR